MAEPLKITLRIDGEEKEFYQEFVLMKYKRKALEIEKDARKPEADPLDIEARQLNLIHKVFGEQFTKKQLEEGLNVIGMRDVLYDIIGVGLLGYPTREELEKKNEEDALGKLMEKLMMEQIENQQS
ncbi:hypothetical protein P9D51_22895 [Bacillus sonorensis]|uniref:phage tail assembly chaperone G n=1 Tax=Bacillus sonorensis TaxID=119858 RepID=UPI002281DED4|nr:hypothetical protein [Bacillus sonorensis]MCY8562213.1 hypothetical protein [Bacillus sonorensis]MEC1428893.1 hypothetical protein [Bacillus sonorensis]